MYGERRLGRVRVATQATIYRSLRPLRAPKIPKKSLCKKVPENTRKSQKNTPKNTQIRVFFGYFSTFSGIFGDFFADPQKDSFRDFFGVSGPEGPETPVNGRLGRKVRERGTLERQVWGRCVWQSVL